jgi:hypothetical protein
MQLLGEEVHAQVSVLASRWGGSDADDLARTALEDQQVADSDVVGWDGNGVGRVGGDDGARSRLGATASNGNINLLTIMVVVMVAATDDAFSGTVETVSERVVVACGSQHWMECRVVDLPSSS